jgi:hypothetical protein
VLLQAVISNPVPTEEREGVRNPDTETAGFLTRWRGFGMTRGKGAGSEWQLRMGKEGRLVRNDRREVRNDKPAVISSFFPTDGREDARNLAFDLINSN